MFSLFFGLYEYLFRKDVYHILILGVDRAGKTNVLERFKTLYTPLVGLDPGKILPTVGLNVGRLDAAGQSLVLWDLGGQTGLRSIWDKYYDESHAVIFVVDAHNLGRLDESKAALDRVLGSHLEAAASAQQIYDHLGVGLVHNRPIRVLPVCAYTGQGMKEALEWLIQLTRISNRTQRLRVRQAR
ncbi:small Arf-related GTPase [Haematococcus lacustris]